MKLTNRFWMFVTAVLLFSMIAAPIQASGPVTDEPTQAPKIDNRPDPKTEAQIELKKQAIEAKVNGKAKGKVHEVAKGQFVELERESEDPVWTVLGEFSDLKHNQIPQPDRNVDNSTLWVEDFSKAHFDNILYSDDPNSMRSFYAEQSSGRYSIYGEATNWVTVSGPMAQYNDDVESPLGGNAVWHFLNESVDGWYNMQLAAGKTPAEIDEYLKGYDIWDRYDADGDGNFDEADGYIDHAQFIHAGEGEEAGASFDAIWSHSWYAFSGANGPDGAGVNYYGGVRIGDSSIWVGKYTVQPENGGVGVFAHEYGHDLGLPDLYDTAGGDNGTAFWTLMSSGSWLGDGTVDIGSKPNHMGAWEKYYLGWLNYEVASAGAKSEHKLGPSMTNTKQAQALFVVLPKKAVTTSISKPFAGEKFYYSGMGDNLNNFMTRQFTLPASAQLSAMVRYNIELDWDYAYVVVSTDGGANWTRVATNLSTNTSPNGQNFGNGITGSSRGNWVNLTADLSAFTGNVLVGFNYWTDVAESLTGFMVDEITVTGAATDGAESDAGWTYTPAAGGFRVTNGTETRLYNHYYVAEYRTYRGFDSTLQVGPYNFGWTNDPNLGNKVEHFPYQDGLLINYWDTSQANNQTIRHPGAGMLLPIDAHPKAMVRNGNILLRNRIQSYDATFGLEATDPLTLHFNSVAQSYPSLKAVSVFDDRNSYYDPANPQGSVKNPNTNTQIRVKSVSAQDNLMQVEVRPAK